MTPHPLDIPAFLKIPPSERSAAWKGRKLTNWAKVKCAVPTREEEAATRKLRREIAAQEKAKREARFAELRERHGR